MNESRYERLNLSGADLEMQWVSLDMKNMRRIIIINIYRPPKGDYKRACKLISEAIREADLKDNSEVYVLGDFNINLCAKSEPASKNLLSTMSLWGLKPFIKEATRLGWVNGTLKGTCIDNIFSNSDVITEARVLLWNFSDHLVVTVTRKRQKTEHKKIPFIGRSYRDYVREDLQSELIDADWGKFFEAGDPSHCWAIIEDRTRDYLNRTCPLKAFKVREICELWVTNELLEEIKDKDRALREARRSGRAEDWTRAKAERNRVGRLVEQVKGIS